MHKNRPITDQNIWRSGTNDELQAMYRKPDIVTTVSEKTRIGWSSGKNV
jgi:hypothetical protein